MAFKRTNQYRRQYRELTFDITLTLLLALVISLVLLFKYISPDKNKDYYHDYTSSPVTWQEYQSNQKTAYLLSRDDRKALIISCKNKRLMVNDYSAMSVVRLLKGKTRTEHNLTSMGIDGKLWHVPVINDTPNPTKEQILFLRALSQANIITFQLDGVKYTWTTTNQSTLEHCVDLNQAI